MRSDVIRGLFKPAPGPRRPPQTKEPAVEGLLAKARHDVEDAGRQPGLEAELRQPDRRSGDCSAGFSTTELPASSAGPSFQAVMISG